MKKLLKKYRDKFQIFLLRLFSFNGLSAGLYYLLVSGDFRREQLAVIKGRIRYYEQNEIEKEAFYLLRRNVHRLEKGLIMKNRRTVFALEYIIDTVEAYIKVVSGPKDQVSDKNLKWYKDVLINYFEVVDHSNSIVQESHELFAPHLDDAQEISKQSSIPYKRDFGLLNVTYDDILNLAKLRRSVRWYERRKVPRQMVDKAIEVAALSPSACNRQPFEFRIFDDQELVQKVANITWGTSGFSQNFPGIIVVLGKLEAYFDERDRHVIYIDGALASMSLMYAFETLGLSSCPINWPDVGEFERKMTNILGLDKNERPIMLISYGFPDKNALVPFSEKKDLFEIRSYNKAKSN